MNKLYFEILRPGINTTIQDKGRNHLFHIGITASGAIDQRNYKLANSLLKNQIDEVYGLIIHGDKDNISSFDSSKILAEKLQKQKKVSIKFKSIKGADHFYENYTEEFVSTVDEYIKENL